MSKLLGNLLKWSSYEYKKVNKLPEIQWGMLKNVEEERISAATCKDVKLVKIIKIYFYYFPCSLDFN